MLKIRVAIIGLGKMGLMHASIMGMLENVELVALCEKSAYIRRFSKKVLPNINVVGDLQNLSDLGLAAVYVTTPPSSHFPIIKTIYDTDIARNVFTEKPLASTHAQAEELCNLASNQGGINMVGYHRRFAVTFQKAKQILDKGDLGELASWEGYAYSADFLGAKPSQSVARGGVLEDSGCHIVDLALWFFRQMEVKSAHIESLLGDGSEDEGYFEVVTSEGLKGEFRASWCKENCRLPEMGLLIKGSSGTLAVNEDKVEVKLRNGNSLLWYKHDLDDTVPFFIGGAEYVREDELFIRAILDGHHVEPSFQTATGVERVIDQVRNHARGLTS